MEKKLGRPQKILDDVHKRIRDVYEGKYMDCFEFIQDEMSQGASLTEIKASLGLWNDTYERFMEQYPDFKDAIKKGQFYSESWWLRKGRENLENQKFSPTLWYMNMKNRFGWRDKQEVEHSGEMTQKTVVIDAGNNPYKK